MATIHKAYTRLTLYLQDKGHLRLATAPAKRDAILRAFKQHYPETFSEATSLCERRSHDEIILMLCNLLAIGLQQRADPKIRAINKVETARKAERYAATHGVRFVVGVPFVVALKNPELRAAAAPIPVARQQIDPNDDAFLRSYEWRRVRVVVLKRDGARCCCCGASPATGAVMNVDHIKPRKFFPELALDPTNLQVLCEDCNHGKGNWDMTDWRAKETAE